MNDAATVPMTLQLRTTPVLVLVAIHALDSGHTRFGQNRKKAVRADMARVP